MQVFREAVEKNGGPLPLLYYLQPDAGPSPDQGAATLAGRHIDLQRTRVDRRTFFECVLSDTDFAVLTTFMMSGVPASATRDVDGASALHIAAAGTLDVLHGDGGDGERRRGSGAGDGVGAASSSSGWNSGPAGTSAHGGDHVAEQHHHPDGGAWSDLDDADTSTGRLLNPPCKNQLIISFLIDNGADVNAAMSRGDGQTPLMVAAARQNMRAIKLLLAKGADVNALDARGQTVLSYAAAYPHVMETLRVWMGEDAFAEAAARERLLHKVCSRVGNVFAALYLIEQVGLDVNLRDGEVPGAAATGGVSGGGGGGAWRPAMSPISNQSSPGMGFLGNPSRTSSTATGGFLLDDDRDDHVGHVTPPRNGRSLSPSTAGPGGVAVAVSTALLAHGGGGPFGGHASPDRLGTPVVAAAAASGGNVMQTRALHSGDTPLHRAVSAADASLVRALLSKGADVMAVDGSGVTPLHLAQSLTAQADSWRQYWKDELVLRRRPAASTGAALGARRRRWERLSGKDARKVKSLLTAYSRAHTAAARQRLLEERPAQYVWELCTSMDVLQFLATATLPHVFYFLCCTVITNFYLLLCVLPVMYASYIGMQRRDSRRARSRPLAGLGWCFGFLAVQALCLPFFTTYFYYKYYSFSLEEHHAVSLWLIPSALLSAVLGVYVVLFSSPGIVVSTEGQRKGIYASLRNAKGDYPKELLYGIDLRTMVRKPLRAQYCHQLQRVVLRLDHFCPYFGTVIGGGNHRAFVWLHVAMLTLFSCFYYYAREYSRLMSSVAGVARTSVATGAAAAAAAAATGRMRGKINLAAATEVDRIVMEKFAMAPFATAERRFAYMYSQVVLPAMLIMTLYVLYLQLCAIARNLTFFDLEHGDNESSVYCFPLGNTLYSLYDRGTWANVAEFFGWTSLTQQTYRVPQMNTYLQGLVEDHQRWQVTTGGGEACCDNHGHQHGHTHPPSPQPANTAFVDTRGEKVGPAEWGDDESARTQQMLLARQREALTAAAVASPAFASSAEPHGAAGADADDGSHAEHDGAGDDDGAVHFDDDDDGGALAMHIFQEMIRVGSDDVGRTVGGGGGGADGQVRQDWDAAVTQARQMYHFYQQSLQKGAGENY